MKKINFLNLGKHPITNNFLSNGKPKNEFFYNLRLAYHSKTKLISLNNFVPPKKMFNNKYAHRASASMTMREAYGNLAQKIKKKFNPKSILEIGSNDGVFIKHFSNVKNIGVEPCKNLAELTTKMKVKTYDKFWTFQLSNQIIKKHGKFDVIYSANTISHIHKLDETFKAIENSLNLDGVFILEDPSLLKSLQKLSYDQFYDEHAYVFSITALKNITKKSGLEIFNIEELKTHGGSNRVYFKKIKNKKFKISKNVYNHLSNEKKFGIHKLKTYRDFAKKVQKSKESLIKIFQKIKKEKKKIIGYGATYKSSTVLNFCKINKNFISYFVDTTPTKSGKFTPGSRIPIKAYKGISDDVDYAFLGAWNFKDEIFKKEKKFIKRGGKFITHVPFPKNYMRIKKIELIKLRNEITSDIKPLNTTKDIISWYKGIIKKSKVKIKTIPLAKCDNWRFNNKGQMVHKSGSFYKVEGVRVLKSFKREINFGWDQPMFTEPGYDGGILGLLKTNINKTPHYLINAKFEPGNYKFIQLSPTVQATFSNINRTHGGKSVKFLEYFTKSKKNNCKIIFKQWVSEEGGRLKNKRNLGILAEYSGNKKIKISSDYKWVTLRQIKELILQNAMINPHLRTLVSFI